MIKPAEDARINSSADRYKAKFPLSFTLTLITLTLGLIILILYYFNHQREVLTSDIKSDLKVIAEMKVKQISNWREERLQDGYMVYDNKIMVAQIKKYVSGRYDGGLKSNLENWFRDLCNSHNYISLRLANETGDIFLSYPEDAIKIGKNALRNIAESKKTRKPYLSDFHFYESTERIHLDMVIPLSEDTLSDPENFLLLEIDPKEYIYPLIQVWPSESETAETLIIERAGDEVIFLTDVRHISGTALKLKIKLDNDSIPAVKAAKGITGIVEGNDYRMVPVLAYIEPIPGTNWKLIAKKDKSEIYSDINVSFLWVAILVFLVLLTAGGVIFLYWGRQKEKYLKSLVDGERKRIALTSHFENVIKNANDVFLLYNENARIVEVNKKALQLYGYTYEEFLNLGLNDLRAPDMRGDVKDTVRYVKNHPEGLLIETIHVKKDGTIFPIESSTRYLQIGSKFYFQSVVRDISERKQAEADLRESEEKFSSIFKYSPVAVLIASAEDGRIADANDVFVRDIEFKKEELIGKTTVEIGFFADMEERTKFVEDIEKTGKVYAKEYKFSTKTGKVLDCLVSSVKIKFGEKNYYISSILDITDRKRAEERIEYFNRLYAFLSQVNQAIVRIDNSQELYEAICKIAIDFGKFNFAWIGLIDRKGRKIIPKAYYGNEKGYLKVIENSEGNNLDDNTHLRKLADEGINIVTNDISSCDFYINDKKDALERGYESSGIFPLRENGKITGILCLYSDKINSFDEEEVRLLDEVTMDISFALDFYIKEKQRRETNDALMKSEKKFRTLFDNAGDAILLIDDYRFIEFNKVAEKFFKLTRNDLLFKNPADLSPEYQPDGQLSETKAADLINSAYSGNNVKFEWQHLRSDGTKFDAEISLNCVYMGSMKMILAVIHDISERKEYEDGLKSTAEKAEEMNRIKSNFLANMSHELRTPMTGILGFADILSKTLEDPEQKEMAEVIFKGGRRLTNTLNMILDLSKIEAEKIDINLKPNKLSEIVIESVKLFEATAREKNLEINHVINEDVTCIADAGLLEQVLTNLIKNAIIYTEKGSVEVSLSKVIEENEEYAEINVTDTGIGIPEKSIGIIFEPFRQVSEGWTRTFEGTGLGLTISKRFIELMNGTIRVRSKLNEGTTFTIRLKAFTGKEESERSVSEKEKAGRLTSSKKNIKTLLVEDDEFIVYTIKKILKDICNFDFAGNGADAVKKANENRYQLILMDIGLKGMDGLEATKEIRKIPGYEKTPIVALTAYAMEGDREKFFIGGCSHYLSKPFSNSELFELVESIV